MFKELYSVIKYVYTKEKPILADSSMRLGTKIAINWLVFSAILIVWLIIGIPILTMFYPSLSVYAANLSNIIIALIGGATVVFSSTEARKTIETCQEIKSRPPAKNEEESPKSPFVQS